MFLAGRDPITLALTVTRPFPSFPQNFRSNVQKETSNMRAIWKALFALSLASPVFAGALLLEIGNPSNNLEAKGKQAVLIARTTACHSPEKTAVTATAEGIVDGSRKTIPLNVIPLSKPGTFIVRRAWPEQGDWAIKMIATNPDYKNYATGVLVPVEKDSFQWAAVKHYFHAPSAAEIDAVLGNESVARARVN
jgi:hypothetical protein